MDSPLTDDRYSDYLSLEIGDGEPESLLPDDRETMCGLGGVYENCVVERLFCAKFDDVARFK